MTVIRKAQEFFEGELSRLLKRPLARRETYSLDNPTTPASLGITSTKNTAIVAKYDGIGYVVCYDRQVLSTWLAPTLAVMPPMAITHSSPKTTHDLWYDFDRRYQLGISIDEIVDEIIDVTTGSVKFTLNDKNPWFIGSVTVPVVKVFLDGDDLVYDYEWMPAAFEMTPADALASYGITAAQYDGRIDATLLTYGVDYSAKSAVLSTIVPQASFDNWTNISSANATALAAALNAVDGTPWINGASNTAYNLANSCVVYNGPTEGYFGLSAFLAANLTADCYTSMIYAEIDNVVNKDYANVLIVLINLGYGANNLRGAVVAHYGEKIRTWSTVPDTLPAPHHHWPLDVDTRNLGTDSTPLNPELFKFTLWPNYESVANLREPTKTLPMNVSLPANVDFTLSFTQWRGNNDTTSRGLFTDAAGTQVGSIFTNGGLWQEPATALWLGKVPANGTRKHLMTLVREGSLTYLYRDGVLCEIRNSTYMLPAWTHMGKAGSFVASATDVIGDIMYWPKALTPKQVAKIKPISHQTVRLIGPPPPTVPPVHDNVWALTEDALNADKSKVAMGGTWTFPTINGEKWGHLETGRAWTPFLDGFSLPLSGDLYFEFDVLLTLDMSYVVTFSTDGTADGYNALSKGCIYITRGRPYVYAVTDAQPSPIIAVGVKATLTVVVRDGILSMYLNGVLLHSAPEPVGATLKGIHNAETSTGQLGNNTSYIKNVKATLRRLTNDELDRALKVAAGL